VSRYILIYLAALCMVAEMALAAILDAPAWPPLRWLVPVLGLCSLVLIWMPMFTLRRYGHIAPGKSYMQGTALVERGLYAVVRHPQYLGYMCLAATFAFVSPHLWTVVLGSLAVGFFYLYTLQEEKRAVDRLGPDYRAYTRRVPRLNVIAGLYRRVTAHLSGGRS
jgi:protein-S-isoprenylcysteine O-methyltransferase Ste14